MLTDSQERFLIGLRHRDVIPGQPAFPGFDLFSFAVGSVAVLEDLVERFGDMGIEHGPLIDRGPGGGVQLDVPDPDGTVIRLLSPVGEHPPFMGLEFHTSGPPSFYDQSRL